MSVLFINKAYDTRSSQAVPHPSTILARRCLTSVIGRERVFSSWYGRRHLNASSVNTYKLISWRWSGSRRRTTSTLIIDSVVINPITIGCHICVGFGHTYIKIGTIQRRLAWPLRKDDTQIREAFQIFHSLQVHKTLLRLYESSKHLLFIYIFLVTAF